MEFFKDTPQDRETFLRFWTENFEDTAEEIYPFFRDTFPHCLVYRAEEAGALCATIYALPQEMRVGGKNLPMVYIYGVATAKEYRNQGLATRLFQFAEADLRQKGIKGAVLVPAGEHLYPFYEKLGYSVFCHRKPILLPAGDTEIGEITADVYLRMREEYFITTAHNIPPIPVLQNYHLGLWDGGLGAWEEGQNGRVYREILGKHPHGDAPATGLSVGQEKPYAFSKSFSPDFPATGYFAFAME